MSQSPLLRRVRIVLAFFALALLVSGLTAIPLRFELGILNSLAGQTSLIGTMWPSLGQWISLVKEALDVTYSKYPFLAYGTDWLAFGHIVIAIAFIGPIKDPVKNVWVIILGIIACVLLVPYAIAFGPLRGIPPFWTFVDTLFGLLGLVPLLLARRWTYQLAALADIASRGA